MTSYLCNYKPMKKEIDSNGNYTIELSKNLELKGTKNEIKLLIANLQRMISD